MFNGRPGYPTSPSTGDFQTSRRDQGENGASVTLALLGCRSGRCDFFGAFCFIGRMGFWNETTKMAMEKAKYRYDMLYIYIYTPLNPLHPRDSMMGVDIEEHHLCNDSNDVWDP